MVNKAEDLHRVTEIELRFFSLLSQKDIYIFTYTVVTDSHSQRLSTKARELTFCLNIFTNDEIDFIYLPLRPYEVRQGG